MRVGAAVGAELGCRLGFERDDQEEFAMSEHHHEEASWLDRWWPLLVIVFGVTFISTLVFFHPQF